MELSNPSSDGNNQQHAGTARDETGDVASHGWLHQPASDLQDHRRRGEWETRYPKAAWVQVCLEFLYAALLLIASITGLIWIGYYVAPDSPADNRNLPLFNLVYPRDRNFLLWISVALSGVAGGAAFDLKWLYHSWAKWTWNCDRLFWRLIVPLLSGCVAVFVSMTVRSGVLSFINPAFFNNFYGTLSAGFLIGYFSDNALAALQNVAMKWFGTVDKRYTGKSDTIEPNVSK